MRAIKREMNNTKWTLAAIGYMCLWAYVVALIVYQLGSFFAGGGFGLGTAAGLAALAAVLYLLFRPAPKLEDVAARSVRSVAARG